MAVLYQKTLVVPDSAIDANGHVNNVMYVQWMQDIAIEHSNANGCDAAAYREVNASWIARSHHIEYHRPALAGDTIILNTWVTSPRKISCVRKYQFVRAEDSSALATAQTHWVYVHADTGRPRAIDQFVIDRFEFLPDDASPT